MKHTILSFAVLAATIGFTNLPTQAHASSGIPRIQISDATAVSDGQGNKTASFTVAALYDAVLDECQADNPDCNRRQFSFCVGYHTVPGTATANLDFIPVSDQLRQTVVVNGPDLIDIGNVDVTVLGDSLIEGTENFTVQLTGVVGCDNDGSMADSSGKGTIVDGVHGLPDLQVNAINVVEACEIELTLTNTGSAGVPESAYHPTAGASVEMRADGQAWGGLRLNGVDPSRLLQTPGASVVHRWFPDAANLQLTQGVHQLEATVDVNRVVTESVETNNTRRQRAACVVR